MGSFKGLMVVGAIAVAGASLAAKAGTVFSDSFEGYNGTYATVNAGQTFAQWTVNSGSIDWIGSYWQASDGANSIDLAGNAPGTIQSASFNTQAGVLYTLSFDLSGNPDGNPIDKLVSLNLTGGATPAQASFDFNRNDHPNTRSDMMWQHESTTFMGTGGAVSVVFSSVGQDNTYYGAALDNVKVATAVPLPVSVYGGAALLGGLVVARRLRRA